MTQLQDGLRETLRRQGVKTDTRASARLAAPATATTLAALRSRAPTPEAPGALPSATVGPQPDADFVVLGRLGRGGMGEVLLARQRALGREVALKRLLDADGSARALLMHEAIVTGALEHPSIVPVHALLDTESGPVAVMKRVSGVSWGELIERGDAPLSRHLEILLSVVNAVAFAHSRGILHRDIKPENVMIGDFGEAILLDWGLAAPVDAPTQPCVIGTPAYLAPEMVEGRTSVRSDVYLLGACLHEVLTGRPRNDGVDVMASLALALEGAAGTYGPDVPRELAEICERACARREEDRYESALALREALRDYQTHSASNLLTDTGLRGLAQLRALVADGGHDRERYAQVQALFGATRFAFERALATWQGSAAAQSGLRDCLATVARYELDAGHVEAAAALLEITRDPPSELTRQVRAAQRAAEQAQGRLAALEEEFDPRVGARGRGQAWLVLAAAVSIMTGAVVGLRVLHTGDAPSAGRLAVIGGLVFAIVLAVVSWWRRRGGYNLVNRVIAHVSVGTVAASFLFRLTAFYAGAAPHLILMADAFLIAAGGYALSMFHRAGRWLSMAAVVVGVSGAVRPDVVDELFIALTLGVALGALALRTARRVG